MTAYLIGDIEVLDPVMFADYRARVPAVIAAFGGSYKVRGGAIEVLEDDWTPNRCVILEFPDMAALKRFYTSPEYAPLLEMRKACTRSKIIAVEGYVA